MTPLRWLQKRIVELIIAIVITGTAAFALIRMPAWLDLSSTMEARERIDLEMKFLAGVVFIVTVILSLRRLRASEDTAQAAVKSATTAQESQITERFTKAVEQLASEKLEIRLGGIYALERISRDSPRDQWTIIEILCAFVRMHASTHVQLQNTKALMTRPENNEPLREDIQAIMTVIARRDTSQETEEQTLDLRDTNLSYAYLYKANLAHADLGHSLLVGANLNASNLRGCDLNMANLSDAALFNASLAEANLRNAKLKNARLDGADMRGTTLGWCGGDLLINDQSVNMSGVFDTEEVTLNQLKSAVTDHKTILPSYLRRDGDD